MKDRLTISSDLGHDGDGLVRYRIRAENADFRGSTLAWGSEIDAEKLADVLTGFPTTTPSSLEYQFGDSKSGECRLLFQTLDHVGHCCVWATISEPYSFVVAGKFQSVLVCLTFTPASLDDFCAELRRFESGKDNEASLKSTEL